MARIITFIILLIFIFVLNAKDFDNLHKGATSYIQTRSGLLGTCFLLMAIPPLVFNLWEGKGFCAILILEVVYISAYTYFF